ncbi:MAG: sensor domain-containing diguanylate cyclase [Clostridiales bacterium]|jgi:diguanylate cyclase (GGDEF)-like protein|nr:sensor domain-containing diguanylate cyclase [Clostridiales bacterium]
MISESVLNMINTMPYAGLLRNSRYKCVHANEEMAELFGFNNVGEFVESCDELSPVYQPDGIPSRNKLQMFLQDVMGTGKTMKYDWHYFRRDKELLHADVTLVRVEVDEKWYLLEFIQDINESKRARITEREANQRLQAMMDSCPVVCGLVDIHFNLLEINNEVGNLFGVFNKQYFIDRFFELSPEYQPDGQLSRRKALDKLKQTFEAGRVNYEWLHKNARGDEIPCAVTLVRIRLCEQDRAIMYIRDLREVKKSIAQIEKMQSIAYTDELTGLFNRRYFMDNANEILTKCKIEKLPFHIIMVDLDYFKSVNDTYGHLIGDEVLKITAKRMGGVTHRNNLIARFGGEEFIIMLSDMSYESALQNAWRIQKTMEESSFTISDLSLDVTTSVGIATLTDTSDSLDNIIHLADMALYAAKRTGRNKVMEYEQAKDMKF